MARKSGKDAPKTFLFFDEFLDSMLDMTAEEIRYFMLSIRAYRNGEEYETHTDRFVRRELERAIELIEDAEEAYRQKRDKLLNNFKAKAEQPKPEEPKTELPVPTKRETKRFVKPSLPELVEFFLTTFGDIPDNRIEAEKFHDFFESKGWMVGKSPMKDWKAAARNWMRNNRTNGNNRANNPYQRRVEAEQQLAQSVAAKTASEYSAEQLAAESPPENGVIPLQF